MAAAVKAASRAFKLAMVQLHVTADKAQNVSNAVAAVRTAAAQGAKVVVLPECFNSPYGSEYFQKYAEPVPGPSTDALGAVSRECNVVVVGGSVPEQCGDKLYNTSTVYNYGDLVAKHRKVHLFDIDVPGRIRFMESETLSAGDNLCIVNLGFVKIGVAICYDIRFQEMMRLYALRGCDLLCIPGAFNLTTGPAHWELLLRSRAVDNQMFVAGVSPARDMSASYKAWGHSTAVDPWGDILGKAAETETIVYADIDLDKIKSVRASLPIIAQRRLDVYTLPSLLKPDEI